jgi:hypothetical protein
MKAVVFLQQILNSICTPTVYSHNKIRDVEIIFPIIYQPSYHNRQSVIFRLENRIYQQKNVFCISI